MPNGIVGRKAEIEILEECYQSSKANFIAVYGRRRVGKTYLIKSHFDNRIFFTITGIANSTLQKQITNFNTEAKQQLGIESDEFVTDWLTAFQLLRNKISKSKFNKKVIFIDEMPWLDTRNSGFIQALEHFWNGWANMRKDVLLIACGSAASWMINKLINNKGGLHNRVTRRLPIEPFTLAETEAYLKNNGAVFSRYQIVQLYMVFGGIPYYLEQINVKKSDVQNINNLCFSSNAFFRTEYDLLFSSLFNKHERHQTVIAALAKKGSGMTRNEIIKSTRLDSGGTTSAILNELEASSFIKSYPAYGKKEKDRVYQLVDFYSLFYLNHIRKVSTSDINYWQDNYNTSKYLAWAGYSFEVVCLIHSIKIKEALGIKGIGSQVYSWRSSDAQIDLIINRNDHVINLCEIKFSVGKYKINKKYALEIQNKISSFLSNGNHKNKAIFPTIITTYGLENSIHNGVFINQLQLNDIFL